MSQELGTLQQVIQLVTNFLVTYAFQIAGAIIILVAGFVVANWVGRVLLSAQERRNVDLTLRQFIASTARVLVIVMFVIMALSKLGISITPLIAALGGLAVGASFAIQGPVSNYGAGMVVILTRMFKVGDTINVRECSGVVADITLSSTRLVAEHGEDIIIPNKHIVGEILRNSYAKRLVEGRIGIDPQADIPRALEAIATVVKELTRDLDAPAPLVGIEAFEDDMVIIGYRYWVSSQRYFETLYAVNNAIHAALEASHIHLASRRLMASASAH
jgi:small conductance mechanosensitive channel